MSCAESGLLMGCNPAPPPGSPAGLHYIQPPGGPRGAGGAAGAIYRYLGIAGDASFSPDIVQAVTAPGLAKCHEYTLADGAKARTPPQPRAWPDATRPTPVAR